MNKIERRKIKNDLRYQRGDLDDEKAWLLAREIARNVLLALDLNSTPNFSDVEEMCELILYLPEKR
jgi:hypothetical protein